MDIPTIDMEGAMIDVLGGAVTYGDGMVSYLAMENSFNVIASQVIFSDLSTVAIGFCIVLLFVVAMLGNILDKIENRVSIYSSTVPFVPMGANVVIPHNNQFKNRIFMIFQKHSNSDSMQRRGGGVVNL